MDCRETPPPLSPSSGNCLNAFIRMLFSPLCAATKSDGKTRECKTFTLKALRPSRDNNTRSEWFAEQSFPNGRNKLGEVVTITLSSPFLQTAVPLRAVARSTCSTTARSFCKDNANGTGRRCCRWSQF